MFPHGGPGVGLLLLRLSVAAILVVDAARHSGASFILLLCAFVALVAVSLSLGFLTPYLSIVAGAAAIVNLLIGASSGSLLHVFLAINAVALTLLGPGAYSLDARLFGRRLTVVMPRRGRGRP